MAASFVAPHHFGLEIGAEPVRRIAPRTDRPSMPGWFSTRKGTLRCLRTESLLELDGLEQLEVNPDCELMAAQPHHLAYFDEKPDGTTVRRIYTPDVAVLKRDGTIVVIDFKIEKFAKLDSWQRQEERLKQLYERDHGVVFATITDAEIRVEPRYQNAKIMMLHRPVETDVEAETAVLAALDELAPPRTIAQIKAHCALEAPLPEIDRAFSAVVALALKGALSIDLSTPIGAETKVSIEAEP